MLDRVWRKGSALTLLVRMQTGTAAMENSGRFLKKLEIETINKWDLIKILCTIKETISKVKRQLSEWEKITVNETTDKELICKIYKQLRAAQHQKNKQHNQKLGKDLKRHFSKEDIHMANKHMKRCSTLLIIREMQIKTTMRYHITLVRMAVIKMLQ